MIRIDLILGPTEGPGTIVPNTRSYTNIEKRHSLIQSLPIIILIDRISAQSDFVIVFLFNPEFLVFTLKLLNVFLGFL